MSERVSIIIPVYNRADELGECIRSIETQDYADREVIVVDDGSTDDTPRRIRAEFPAARVAATPGRMGPAYARNVGLHEARGQFVLFLDSDTRLPRPGWLAHVVGVLGGHPDIAILGGEIRTGQPASAWGRNVRFNGVTVPIGAPAEPPDTLVECDYVATCNCLARADDIRAAGGFDPYYGFGGEDVDFCLRVARGRGRCCISYATAVEHRQSPRGRHPDETYRYHRTRVRQQLKNAGPAQAAAGFVFDLFRALAFYLLLPVKLLFKLARRRPLRRENLLGGYLLMKAYAFNIARLGETRRARRADFLSPDEMTRFEQFHREQATA